MFDKTLWYYKKEHNLYWIEKNNEVIPGYYRYYKVRQINSRFDQEYTMIGGNFLTSFLKDKIQIKPGIEVIHAAYTFNWKIVDIYPVIVYKYGRFNEARSYSAFLNSGWEFVLPEINHTSNKGLKSCFKCSCPTEQRRDFSDMSIREFCPRCKI